MLVIARFVLSAPYPHFPCTDIRKYLIKICNQWPDILLSRWGSRRLDLNPGTLLVATSAMPSPFFFGSVVRLYIFESYLFHILVTNVFFLFLFLFLIYKVLLYEHKRCSGSRGLILNMAAQVTKRNHGLLFCLKELLSLSQKTWFFYTVRTLYLFKYVHI